MDEWKSVNSNTKPLEIDNTISSEYVYVRRNIVELSRVDELTGETLMEYNYEELLVKKENWNLYQMLMKNQANVDYLMLLQ